MVDMMTTAYFTFLIRFLVSGKDSGQRVANTDVMRSRMSPEEASTSLIQTIQTTFAPGELEEKWK